MKIKWTKTGKTVSPEGTTITYAGIGTTLTIESRKRVIPHANRSGTWEHTTYWLLDGGREIREYSLLAIAKERAQEAYDRGEICASSPLPGQISMDI